MMRVTKGDIVIDCDTQAELAIALAVLQGGPPTPEEPPALWNSLQGHPIRGPFADAPFGPFKAELFNPDVPPMDCAIGLPEYISPEDEQRLRLVPNAEMPTEIPALVCGPAGDPRTDTFLPGEHVEYPRPELSAVEHIPVSRKLLDVLDVVVLFPEGVWARGVHELTGLPMSIVSGRLEKLKQRSLVEHPEGNQKKWRATQLARRSKLVAC